MQYIHINLSLLAALFFIQEVECTFDPILFTGCTTNTNCTSQFSNSYCDFDVKVDCDIGVCMCEANRVPVPINPDDPNRIYCQRKATSIGYSCQHDTECIGTFDDLSRCVNNDSRTTCECTSGSVYCEGASLKVKACVHLRLNLGEPCSGCDAQCSRIPGAICSVDLENGDPWRCRCGNNYVESEDGSKCIPVAVMLGGKCDTDGTPQCVRIPNSICEPVSKTCRCNNETHVPEINLRSCLPKHEHLGMSCLEYAQCQSMWSECILGFCACNDSMVQSRVNPDSCVPIRRERETCSEHIQCTTNMGPKAECIGKGADKTCHCKHGHMYNSRNSAEWGRCYPLTPIGGKCYYSVSEQCVDATGSAAHTDCRPGIGAYPVCSCGISKQEREGICHPATYIGDPCKRDMECQFWITGPALCDLRTKTCGCDTAYEPLGSRECRLIP